MRALLLALLVSLSAQAGDISAILSKHRSLTRETQELNAEKQRVENQISSLKKEMSSLMNVQQLLDSVTAQTIPANCTLKLDGKILTVTNPQGVTRSFSIENLKAPVALNSEDTVTNAWVDLYNLSQLHLYVSAQWDVSGKLISLLVSEEEHDHGYRRVNYEARCP